jgi:hypothetical protein
MKTLTVTLDDNGNVDIIWIGFNIIEILGLAENLRQRALDKMRDFDKINQGSEKVVADYESTKSKKP